MIGLNRSIESSLVERERRRDCSIRREMIRLHRIVSLLLDEYRNVRDHIPIPHEPLQVHMPGDRLQLACGFRLGNRLATDQPENQQARDCKRGFHEGILFVKVIANKIIRDRNNQNILAVAYLLGSLHSFGLMKLDYDLFRADTTTPKLTFWSCRE